MLKIAEPVKSFSLIPPMNFKEMKIFIIIVTRLADCQLIQIYTLHRMPQSCSQVIINYNSVVYHSDHCHSRCRTWLGKVVRDKFFNELEYFCFEHII